jgi:hypothetical protein
MSSSSTGGATMRMGDIIPTDTISSPIIKTNNNFLHNVRETSKRRNGVSNSRTSTSTNAWPYVEAQSLEEYTNHDILC